MSSVANRPRSLALLLIYFGATVLSFPVLEALVSGPRSRDFAHDVFDDGAVSRLGAIVSDFSTFGPVLWNAHLMSGNAYFGQFNASPVAFDASLAFLTTPYLAYVATLALMALLAGLSMHFFLEDSVGLPRVGALAGGLVYILGFRHYAFGFSAILLPLLLWLSDRVARWPVGTWRRAAPLALCAAFLLYNFSPQPAALTAGLHLAYVFVAAPSRGERRARLKDWAVGWGLALVLYAPVLVTILRMLPESQRMLRDHTAGIPSAGAAVGYWIQYYGETFLSRPAMLAAGARVREGSDGTWYAGAVGIVLLVLSAGLPRRTRRERALAWMLVVLPLADLLSMLIVPLQTRFGLLRSFELSRVRLFLPFALAANVGVAAAVLLRQWREGGLSRLRLRISGAAAAALFGVSLLLCTRSAGYLIRSHGVWAADAAIRERALAWLASAVYFAVAALGIVALIWRHRRMAGAPPPPTGSAARPFGVGLAFMLLLVADRVAYARIERRIEPRLLGSYEEALGPTPGIRFLERQPNPQGQRILMLADHSAPNRRDHPNRFMFRSLFSADGYQLVYPLRYHELFGKLTQPHLDKDPYRWDYFHKWGQRAYLFGPEFNLSLASLMAVRWLYARGVPFDAPGWKLVFDAGGEKVFENTEVFPRGFLAARQRAYPDRGTLYDALASASVLELRETAFVEEGARLNPAPSGIEEGQVHLSENTPDRLGFQVSAAGPAALIVSDVFAPGWKARINGIDARIVPVNGAFRGVAVPGGQSDVVFSYEPGFTRAGALAAAVGGAVLAVILLSSRRAAAVLPAGEAGLG